MLYSFDNWGWLSETDISGRQTNITPPDQALIPEGCRPNFTGYSWIVLPYTPPSTHPPLPDYTQEKLDLGQAIYEHMNQVVQQYDYKTIDSACLRVLSSNPSYKAQGEAAMAWRDAVDAKCEEILMSVISGERLVPSLEELIAELPVLEWPS